MLAVELVDFSRADEGDREVQVAVDARCGQSGARSRVEARRGYRRVDDLDLDLDQALLRDCD
jgi:hypothetical protein